MDSKSGPLQNPFRSLAAIFLAWKAVLFLLAALCPGPGYDTSAHILFSQSQHRATEFQALSPPNRLILNLFRWDALYFVNVAQRGYVYEQEWAFSWAYTRILNIATTFLSNDSSPSLRHYIFTGVVLSNLCHLGSAIVLYLLLKTITTRRENGRIPFIASVLHIISPAGMFLCAPYAEALFSFLNFFGMLLYASAKCTKKSTKLLVVGQDILLLASGLFFAAATAIRSNGLLSGLIFLFDVARSLSPVFSLRLTTLDIRRLVVTCVAGSLTVVGYIGPQLLAYREYCATSRTDLGGRPWCNSMIPSIYSWVQSTYWNVGFLQYWTLSNLPLFVLASPMLWLLSVTSAIVLSDIWRHSTEDVPKPYADRDVVRKFPNTGFCNLPELALPQLVLTITAATTFHVQIINRLSSGYPIWYLVAAEWISESKTSSKERRHTISEWVTRGIVMYSLTQGMLFANFLPPA
ncbi:GPI mannosyltransferas-like protein 2 [Lojkania enalia]|uniref:GPI mannosyltransferase 2 n=1 Tax=Lojkania enalia TaxID=147567 RepID=A0A9P4K279_9PLEO|nr:GPI mannosyltransferas-like protein 2 [Didymosphaeria enalia]